MGNINKLDRELLNPEMTLEAAFKVIDRATFERDELRAAVDVLLSETVGIYSNIHHEQDEDGGGLIAVCTTCGAATNEPHHLSECCNELDMSARVAWDHVGLVERKLDNVKRAGNAGRATMTNQTPTRLAELREEANDYIRQVCTLSAKLGRLQGVVSIVAIRLRAGTMTPEEAADALDKAERAADEVTVTADIPEELR